MEPEEQKPITSEPTAEQRRAETNLLIQKMFIFVRLVEQMYCKTRDQRKQFRQDIIKNGFINNEFINKYLVQREIWDKVSKELS